MNEPTDFDHPVHALIADRWSPRTFTAEPVAESDLRSMLEAARLAPSSFNEQPWAFIVATRADGEAFDTALSGLLEGNRGWAKSAGAIVFSVAKQHFARNDKTNRHAFHDVGLATAQLTLEATARGLVVHLMAGIDVDVIRTRYEIPDGWDVVAGMAIGHPDEERGPRKRNPQTTFVFTGGWGRVRAT